MYFDKCKTFDEAKKEYVVLCKKHHPDKGGDTKVMQDINAEWEKQKYRFAEAKTGPRSRIFTNETADHFKDSFNFFSSSWDFKMGFKQHGKPIWEEIRKQQQCFAEAEKARAEARRKEKLLKKAKRRQRLENHMATLCDKTQRELLEYIRDMLLKEIHKEEEQEESYYGYSFNFK